MLGLVVGVSLGWPQPRVGEGPAGYPWRHGCTGSGTAGAGARAVLLGLRALQPLRALTRGRLVLWGGFLILVVGLVSPLDLSLTIIVAGAGGIVMAAGIVQDYRSVSPLRQQQVPP